MVTSANLERVFRMAYEVFKNQMVVAVENLESVLHSLSLCEHMMNCDPSDKTIADYEKTIQQEKEARLKIGQINKAEMLQRSKDACLV